MLDWFLASCGSCLGPASSQCLSCSSSTQVTSSGTCIDSACSTSFVPYLHVCLEDFNLDHSSTKKALSISLPIILLCLVLSSAFIGWLYVRRERRKTREATLRFADGLDDVEVQKKTRALGVDGVLELMDQVRKGMESRWSHRRSFRGARDSRIHPAKDPKPLWLGSGWKHARAARNPPPYTPLPLDNLDSEYEDHPSSFPYRSRSASPPSLKFVIDSPTESASTLEPSPIESHRSPRLINPLLPSPAYDTLDQTDRYLRQLEPARTPSLASASLPLPPPARSKPTFFKTYSTSTSKRKIDTEHQPFPDFQSDYVRAREQPFLTQGGYTQRPHVPAEGSGLGNGSRFVEGSDSDLEPEDDEQRVFGSSATGPRALRGSY